MSIYEAYPLQWPVGWARTHHYRRQRSRFDTSFAMARDCLLEEINRFNGRNPVLSTNIEIRRDGLPYANRRRPEDTGVAVYFEWKGKPMCFACDKWDRVKDNIQSIRKTIDAMRGIERWGSTDMMERAFSGFAALPDESNETWRDVLDCQDVTNFNYIKTAYRMLAKEHHPDSGGDSAKFLIIQKAYDDAKAEFNQ